MLDEARDYLRRAQKANLLMVAINVAVFLVFSVIGDTEDSHFMLEHGAMYVPYLREGQYYRLFTSMFLHFGMVHLAYNMVCLLSLGDLLERQAGHIRYLIVYLGGGIAGNLVSAAWHMREGSYAVSAGASGAIFAVIGAVLSIVLRRKDSVGEAISKRLGIMALLMIAEGFFEGGTDNAAHVGGFFAGLLLGWILCGQRRRTYQG